MKNKLFLGALLTIMLISCGPDDTLPKGHHYLHNNEIINDEAICCGVEYPMENIDWLHDKMITFRDSAFAVDINQWESNVSLSVVLYTYETKEDNIDLLCLTTTKYKYSNKEEATHFYNCEGVIVDEDLENGIGVLTKKQEIYFIDCFLAGEI